MCEGLLFSKNKFDVLDQCFSKRTIVNKLDWWKNPTECASSSPDRKDPRETIDWEPPTASVLNFNVDGAAKGNPGPAGCGGVLSDSPGAILTTQESNVTEPLSIKVALKVFMKTMWVSKARLVVESDSTIAVKWIKKELERPWCFWKIFSEIEGMLQEIGEVSFENFLGEKNGLACHFAKSGVNRTNQFEAWW
ncbi:uncharacterized protein LOC111282718 [Durio zibethinus]|uniref:Uncharacterized protein LOC111282718 n=1 Tax=Durio zibethinus TaxID=66656 RepID=A0A6P5XEA8_DURZI|nr:uncharacterized protein LOC111282718 [Durio zibethinus]